MKMMRYFDASFSIIGEGDENHNGFTKGPFGRGEVSLWHKDKNEHGHPFPAKAD